jgi:hypothetical protein
MRADVRKRTWRQPSASVSPNSKSHGFAFTVETPVDFERAVGKSQIFSGELTGRPFRQNAQFDFCFT